MNPLLIRMRYWGDMLNAVYSYIYCLSKQINSYPITELLLSEYILYIRVYLSSVYNRLVTLTQGQVYTFLNITMVGFS